MSPRRCSLRLLLVLPLSSLMVGSGGWMAPPLTPPAAAQPAMTQGGEAEGVALIQQGLQQLNTGQFEAALASFQQALTLFQGMGNRQGVAYAQVGSGRVYTTLGQYETALSLYQAALPTFVSLGDRVGEAATLNNLGLVYHSQGAYETALTYYQQSLPISQAIGDRTTEGTTLNNLGEVYRNLSQYENALQHYQQSLAISQAVGNRVGESQTLNNLGLVYYFQGDYEQALNYYQQSLTISQAIGDRVSEGTTLANMGGVYDILGHYESALRYHQQSLALRRDLGDRVGESQALNNLGVAYANQGKYEEALDHYQQSLVILQDIGNRAGESQTLSNIGLVHTGQGQYEEALRYYNQSLAIRQEIGDRRGEGETLNNMGLVYDDQGQYEEALHRYNQSLRISQEIGDRPQASITLNNIGEIYRKLGQFDEALHHYEQSLAIAQETGNRRVENRPLNNMGLLYDAQGQYEEALHYYQQSLQISQETGDRTAEGIVFNNIGEVMRHQGQYDQALHYYEQSLQISQDTGDRLQEATTLNNLGLVYHHWQEYQTALSYYQQSLPILQEIGYRAGEAQNLSNIGLLLQALEQPELAIVFLKQSVNQYEAIRGDIRGLSLEQQQSFADSVSSNYRQLADLLLQSDRILEAQRVLDLLKVQELDEYLQNVERSAQTGSGVDLLNPEAEIRTRQQTINNQAIALGEELTQLRQTRDRTPEQLARLTELETLQAEVVAQFEDFIYSDEVQGLVDQLSRDARQQDLVSDLDELITLQDSLAALEQNAVLLYPLILDDRIELVLVTPNSPPARYPVQVSRAELNQAIVAFRQALQSPTRRPEAIAQQLYTWLIQPLAADLEAINAQTILYAPDGVLRYVPLAALYDGQHWLVERYRINHITAASLTNLTLAPTTQPNILAAAFSQGSFEFQVGERNFALSGLPFAGQEVENLAAAFPGTTKLVDADFSPAATVPIMDDYTIVHLATHAEFVQGSPGDSFILFGNGDRVTLEEIKQWRGRFRRVDLIVLSACETGLGESLGNGEEILGFGYLMQQAGARAAIASLWSVSDGGTQTLMDAFYTALRNGYSKAESLQRAQVALIRNDAAVLERSERSIQPTSPGDEVPLDLLTDSQLQGSLDHPYYWAPFILIGNGL